MSKEIKVAFAGAGNMAREHMRAFQGLDNVRLVGVQGRTRSKAEALAKEFGISEVCDSVADLYARTRADLVVVTVREMGMSATAKECFRHPWTCLLEKPAGYDLRDAEGILAAAKDARSTVYVALNRRCYGSTQQALETLVDRKGGNRFIVVNDQQDQKAAAQIGEPPEVVRNYMFANSIHVIDYLRVFGRGTPRSVRPIVPWTPERPAFVVASVEFDSGDVGLYQATWDGPGPWAVTVADSQTRVEMRPLETLTVQSRGERRAVPTELGTLDAEFKPGLRLQAQRVIEAVRSGQPAGLATLEDATQSMRLCAQIFGMPISGMA